MRRILIALSGLAIIGTIILIGVVTYWLNYQYKTIEFSEEVFPVMNENKVVKSGEELIYHVKYCKYTEAKSEVVRKFVDGIIFTTPAITGSVSKGCSEHDIYLPIPKTIPAGKFRVQILYSYKVNPLRVITVEKTTENFTIVK